MKIVLLCGMSESSKMVYNGILKDFNIDHVIQEEPLSRTKLIKRRIKRIGFFTVFNQLLFQVLISPALSKLYQKRSRYLITKYGLDVSNISAKKLTILDSVNTQECEDLLLRLKPDIVIVNGTGIISKRILKTCPLFVNIHAGITPEYRGVHGAYWSLVNEEPHKCGVTVHRVDVGIDTGQIFMQDIIEYDPSKDSFVTYPIHQIAKGIEMLKSVLFQVKTNTLVSYKKDLSISKLYYHPTLTTYLTYFFKGTK